MKPESPVVFLDIDGVLLSTSTWDLPANVRLLRESDERAMSTAEYSDLASFDPVAVMLVNRLCQRTGARIVISTSWRYSSGVPETRTKLEAEGIEPSLFHDDYACPVGRPLDKTRDILDWLQANQDERPRGLALDDEALPGIEQIFTDPVAGFSVADYRLACAWLGGVDKGYGVHDVDPGDMLRIASVLPDPWDSLNWLHGHSKGAKSRSSRLDRETWRRFGDGYVESRRAEVWRELAGVGR
jgi:hypothetical protein